MLTNVRNRISSRLILAERLPGLQIRQTPLFRRLGLVGRFGVKHISYLLFDLPQQRLTHLYHMGNRPKKRKTFFPKSLSIFPRSG